MPVELLVLGVGDLERGRAHSACRELSVTTSFLVWPSSSLRSTSMRIGQEMKSEYRLMISRSFHSAV